jgi:hypothetical protein
MNCRVRSNNLESKYLPKMLMYFRNGGKVTVKLGLKLRALLILNRNIGHDWQFSTKQQELLQQYYDGNKFLVECLNSDCYVSREVRQEIEDTLLLPIAEIEQRKHG